MPQVSALLDESATGFPPLPITEYELDHVLGRRPVTPEMATRIAANVAKLEAAIDAVTVEWRERLTAIGAAMEDGQDAKLDPTITRMLDEEREAAETLANYRRLRAAAPHAPASLKALGDRIEDAMVRRCEQLRDARWDLLALQVKARDRGADQGFADVSDLRRGTIAAR